MADAYARLSGTVAALTVHQGCGLTNALTGLTNALTGLTEAAKSRRPLVVLAAEDTQPRSNFYVDQAGLATVIGMVLKRVASAESAVADTVRAFHRARDERRPVLLNLPLEMQRLDVPNSPVVAVGPLPSPPAEQRGRAAAGGRSGHRAPAGLRRRAGCALGCGARRAHQTREANRDPASHLRRDRGLFHDETRSLDVSGGFSSPLAAELIAGADLIVGWGCSLNIWTMRHGRLIGGTAPSSPRSAPTSKRGGQPSGGRRCAGRRRRGRQVRRCRVGRGRSGPIEAR